MKDSKVEVVVLDNPLSIVGKVFHGDYARSHNYIKEVQEELEKNSIEFTPFKVMGIYYDNPQETNVADLKSFQGVFINNQKAEIPLTLQRLSLQGRFIYVKMKGEMMKAIFDGYGALFDFIKEKKIKLKSSAGYQISTIINGETTTEIYMELS